MTTSDWAITFMLSIMAVVAVNLVMRGRKPVPTYKDVAGLNPIPAVIERIERGLDYMNSVSDTQRYSIFMTLDMYKLLLKETDDASRTFLYGMRDKCSFEMAPMYKYTPIIIIGDNMRGLIGMAPKLYRQDSDGLCYVECQYCNMSIQSYGKHCEICGAPMQAEFNILELHTV
jgi:hypothetical protein